MTLAGPAGRAIASSTLLYAGGDGLRVRLLDAGRAGLDEAGLRAWARSEGLASGAAFVSRSYRYPLALVAWHRHPIGVDIEKIESFDRAFLETICTPSERALPEQEDADGYVTSLWCSKEALAKALGNALLYEPRRLGSPMFWQGGQSGPWRAATLPVPAGHHGWLCWRSSPASDDDR